MLDFLLGTGIKAQISDLSRNRNENLERSLLYKLNIGIPPAIKFLFEIMFFEPLYSLINFRILYFKNQDWHRWIFKSKSNISLLQTDRYPYSISMVQHL